MSIKQYRNIVLISFASILASCDQIGTIAPKTIDGEWKCQETHYETGITNYYISIDYTDSTKKGIKIHNFNNIGGYCNATLSGSIITISKQTINKEVVEGSGNISSDYKSLTFDYNDDAFGGNGGHVTAKCSRLE